MSGVVNVKKACLVKRGIANFQEWAAREDAVYIGRNMSFYVPGAIGSKWQNPFPVKKYGRDECLALYETFIREHPTLYNELGELKGKELGCWCCPEPCHGHVLMRLLKDHTGIL